MKLSELFYSLQGEGASIGKPAVFLRFPGCNLRCKSEYWQCDTLPLLTQKKEYSPGEIKLWIRERRLLDKIVDGQVHLIFTGGEPFLNNRISDMIIIGDFLEAGYKEVETNGTIQQPAVAFEFFDQINCSPKLASSGIPFSDRIKLPVLNRIALHRNYYFKFVVADLNDFYEAKYLIEEVLNLDPKRVYLMPAASTSEDLRKRLPSLWELCLQSGFNLSTRLHIESFGLKTGV